MSIFQKGRSWYYEFWFKGQRYGPKSLGPVNKTVAREAERQIRNEAVLGNLGMGATSDPVFKVFAKAYLEHYRATRKHSSYVRANSETKHFIKAWPNKRLSQITPKLIEDWKTERLNGGIQSGSVRRDLGLLKQMFNTAKVWKQAKSNPMDHVKLPPRCPDRIRFLTHEEQRRLLANMTPYLRPVVEAALLTGFRKTALITLIWHDVDFVRGVVYCRPEVDKGKDGYEVPMNGALRTLLMKLLPPNIDPKAPVFLSRNKRAYHFVDQSWVRAVRKAGIPNLRFHDLRHTFASRLVMAGVHLMVVKELMGHHSISQTEKYAHLANDYHQRAVELL